MDTGHSHVCPICPVKNTIEHPCTERWIIDKLPVKFHVIGHDRLNRTFGCIFAFLFGGVPICIFHCVLVFFVFRHCRLNLFDCSLYIIHIPPREITPLFMKIVKDTGQVVGFRASEKTRATSNYRRNFIIFTAKGNTHSFLFLCTVAFQFHIFEEVFCIVAFLWSR